MNQMSQNLERARGRPADSGRQCLKGQILDVAEVLFAENGYAGTPIRRIADEAGVNPALVHYYFDNKKNLLQTVVKRSVEPLGQAIAAMKESGESSPGQFVELLFSMLIKHPNLPHLLTREVLLPGGEMQEYFAENMAPYLGGALPALLEREKSAGRLREDADPSVSAVLILAMCVFPFIARTLAEPVLGVDFNEQGLALLNEQISELLKRGLMP